jgi:hypothetical protein
LFRNGFMAARSAPVVIDRAAIGRCSPPHLGDGAAVADGELVEPALLFG